MNIDGAESHFLKCLIRSISMIISIGTFVKNEILFQILDLHIYGKNKKKMWFPFLWSTLSS